MDSPVELPNGQLVCAQHGLVICGYCTVDYSFMDDINENDENDEEDEEFDDSLAEMNEIERVTRKRRRDSPTLDDSPDYMPNLGPKKFKGTGRVFASIFTPPPSARPDGNSSAAARPPFPETLFRPALNQCSYGAMRFININDPDQLLVYTDGACLNNGQPDPRAGWAFVYGPDNMVTSRRLENYGPFGGGRAEPQTSNRAELRAVIAALRFRHWAPRGEGFTSIVIATDSEYVVNGATQWAKGWVKKGWKTATGAAVKNKDLWELLLGEVERWHDEGLKVMFWRIGRELNSVADAAAKQAAQAGAEMKDFTDVLAVAC